MVAPIKVSKMTSATSVTPTDVLMTVQNGANKSLTVQTLLNNLNSADNIIFNKLQNSIDFSVRTSGDQSTLFIKGSNNFIGVGTNAPSSKLHVNGNLQVGSSTTNGIILGSEETVADNDGVITTPVALSIHRGLTCLTCGSGVDGIFSLANGSTAQIKTIFIKTLSGGSTAKVQVTGGTYNTIIFDAEGQSIILQWSTLSSRWFPISLNGATLTTE